MNGFACRYMEKNTLGVVPLSERCFLAGVHNAAPPPRRMIDRKTTSMDPSLCLLQSSLSPHWNLLCFFFLLFLGFSSSQLPSKLPATIRSSGWCGPSCLNGGHTNSRQFSAFCPGRSTPHSHTALPVKWSPLLLVSFEQDNSLIDA